MPTTPPPPPKPNLPERELKDFLHGKLKLHQAAKVSTIDANFLWKEGGLERYRVNVWVTEPHTDGLYDRQYIGASYFLHYDRSSGVISDKTLKNEEVSPFST